MTIGLKTTVTGAYVSPNLRLTQSVSDDIDAAAMALFGDDLLLRVDPRNVTRTTSNPTGVGRAHPMAPAGDPLFYRHAASVGIGTVPGLYDGADVFVFDAAANVGERNDMSVKFNSMGAVVAFTVIGVAHFDAAMLGSGFRALLTFRRDGSSNESMLAYQYASGVNYLTGFADQADGGGANHNLNTSTVIAADTPFAFVWQVLASGGSRLFINEDLSNSVFSDVGSGSPETGVMQLLIGSTGTASQQWMGGLARLYVGAGDALETPEKRNRAFGLVTELMSRYVDV